jgi:hypothetical protein
MRKKTGTHAVVTEIVDDKMAQKNGKLLKFDGEPAVLRVSLGTTLNTGNYTSLRLGVDLSLPCNPAKLEAGFSAAEKFVASHLAKMIAKHSPKSEEVEEVDDLLGVL